MASDPNYRHYAKITAPNIVVARFIKFSKHHSSKLSEKFESFANISLRQVKYKYDIELHCHATEAFQSTEQEFENECRTRFLEFLSNYSNVEKKFNEEERLRLFEVKRELCKIQTGEEKEQLLRQWDLKNTMLTIVGLKSEVDEVLREIEECFIDKRQEYQSPFTFIFQSKQLVASFFITSSRHKSYLDVALKDVASVKIVDISLKQSRNNKLAYSCKPLPNSSLSEEKFKIECRLKLIEFLKKYASATLSFHPSHIEAVRSKEPEYFEKDFSLTYPNIRVKWHEQIKHLVEIVGLKDEVKRHELAVGKELDAIAPRIMSANYRMEMDPPIKFIAQFIAQSTKKHLKFFQRYFQGHAKVWFQPDVFTIHFEAENELSQYDIPTFENSCMKKTTAYFRKFDMWLGKFDAQVIEKAQKKEHSLFVIMDSDWMLEIEKESVHFVGLKPYFYPQRNAIIKALKEAEAERKKQVPPPPVHRHPPYYYAPKEKPSVTIIKHIFQSPLDMAALQHVVGSRITFDVYPNETDPHGIEFHPKPDANIKEDYYQTKIPERIADFFERFLVCTKQFKADEPSEMKQIVDVVYRIGEASDNIIERMISMHVEDNALDIVGPENVIRQISEELQATNCEKESVPLLTEKRDSKKESSKKVGAEIVALSETTRFQLSKMSRDSESDKSTTSKSAKVEPIKSSIDVPGGSGIVLRHPSTAVEPFEEFETYEQELLDFSSLSLTSQKQSTSETAGPSTSRAAHLPPSKPTEAPFLDDEEDLSDTETPSTSKKS